MRGTKRVLLRPRAGKRPLTGNTQAKANRDDLRGLYGTLKACDAYVELTFVTGVRRSLQPGARGGTPRSLRTSWRAGSTPRFLVDTLIGRGFSAPALEGLHADDDLLSAFDVASAATEALLFQTGYLTISAEEKDPDGVPLYLLGYPNREVRRGLNRGLLDALAPNWRSTGSGIALRRLLAAEDWAGLEALFRKLLAGIPHDWHRRNDIARYEGYWSSVFYAWFQASMDGVTVEDATSRGRLDLAVVSGGNAYLFEFKVAERAAGSARPAGTPAGARTASTTSGPASHTGSAALAQLKARRYADKYRAPDRNVHLIGVEVSAETRDITAFDVERA